MNEAFPGWDKDLRIIHMECKDIYDEIPEARSQVGSEMPLETPVKNLFNVGDGCLSYGYTGSTGAADSTLRVLDMVKKLLK